MTKTISVEIDKDIFNDAYVPFLGCQSSTQIFYGGSSSGKSVFLAQRDVKNIMQGGRNYLICRQAGNTIMGSVWNEIERVINTWGVRDLFELQKSSRTITCKNGYQFIFAGLQDPERIKSIVPKKGVITDVRIEEATETDYNSVKQLDKRMRGGSENIKKTLTLSFNPILQSNWIYKEYFEGINWADNQTDYKTDELSILKTWYIHNRFLTKDDVYKLENEKDSYFRNVYTYGNWGILGNVIFTNWVVSDLDDEESEHYLPEAQRTNRKNGGDFGYSSDPAALIRTHYDKKKSTIYVFDELYEHGLTNDILAERQKAMCQNDVVTWDSSEPKSIEELSRHGVYARGAVKGKDSVLFGIQWLQQQNIVIHTKCINFRNEVQQYKWKEDAGGNALPIPVDKNNHLIDALRYAYEDEMVQRWYVS